MQNRSSEFRNRLNGGGGVVPKLMMRIGERNAAVDRVSNLWDKIETLKVKMAFLEKCASVVQAISEAKKQEIAEKVEKLVTTGLRAIFEREDYRFAIEMELKRGAMTAKPVLYSAFGEEGSGKTMPADIMEGHGGGVVDVVAFILQIVVLLALAKDMRLAKVIVADEPFKCVSREYLLNVAEFLRRLNQSTGIQFVMVTHKPEFLEVAQGRFDVSLNAKGETHIRSL